MTPGKKEQNDLKFEMMQKILYVEDLQTIKQILDIIKGREVIK